MEQLNAVGLNTDFWVECYDHPTLCLLTLICYQLRVSFALEATTLTLSMYIVYLCCGCNMSDLRHEQ